MGTADGHCDRLLDRSLLSTSLRLRFGMPLGTSVGNSLGYIDGHGLGSADGFAERMTLGV